MLNLSKHKTILIRILTDIYKRTDIGNILGFKGGTACYLFYDLPRFSTDLDFDLIDDFQADLVFKRLNEIISKYGEIKEAHIKKNTIFFLLSYDSEDRNVKIEVSTRKTKDEYEILHYLGLSILVMKKKFIFANKLVALTERRGVASRDLFDINFFFNKEWNINNETIQIRTGKTLSLYLKSLILFIKRNFSSTNILAGLGEVIDNKQ